MKQSEARLGQIAYFTLEFYVFVMTICITPIGCSDSIPSAEWAETVPGVYEGVGAGLEEMIDLKPDGSFQHNVSIGGKPVLAESGAWSLENDVGRVWVIRVEPFTSFWDPLNHKLGTNRVEWSVGTLGVMREGRAARRISPANEWEYQLFKTNTGQTP